ncbi:MAG: alpha/beta hydrolase [Actinomycetia bacterium]|nr:alpha/beta hydrolase [Actinomycetes bacterium]MCH9760433.1 alpha/beta hydrolase [Actinomycetes bacterium]
MFGEGTPQDGTQFDASVKILRLSDEVTGAAPGSAWSGGAALAYQARNASHRWALDSIADLDRRLGRSIDRSAGIVGAGRRDLDALRHWVASAAGSVADGQQRESVFTQIANTGLARLGDIVLNTHAHLRDVVRDIRGIEDEYVACAFRQPPAYSGQEEPADAGAGPHGPSGDIHHIDRANREVLQQMLQEYQQLPDGQAKTDRLNDIAAIGEALTVPDSHLVYLAKPDDPTQMIAAAASVGDPFTADHVSVTVPGVSGSTRAAIAVMTSDAAELRNEARDIAAQLGASQHIATVAWVGYQPPLNLGDSAVLSDDLAEAGAPKLTSFLRGLDEAATNPGQSTALFGHSYGSLTAGIALHDGASRYVDNAVLYGSAGFQADTPAELGMTDDNFFVMSARDDPINTLGALAPYHGWGSDPNDIINDDGRLRFRFQHLDADAGATPILGYEPKTGGSGHSDYGRNAGERMTGYNLAAILLNRPDLAVKATPLSW